MAKTFAPRVKKRERKTIDHSDRIKKDLIKLSDDKLLKGARLAEVRLKDIVVKEQVRTKFNDSSIRELAKNIETNGLIQPLVIHLDAKNQYTLICGERRFRAMSSIDMEICPCFILDDKTEEELMAIQFSENSSREALHFIDKADGILNYQIATKASERKITAALGISKSEVHRSLLIAKLPRKIREAAKAHNIEKYVLLEWDALKTGKLRKEVEAQIVKGEMTKRAQLKKVLKAGGVVQAGRKQTKKSPALPRALSANAFLKVMQAKSKDMSMDKKTRAMMEKLLEESKEIVDF